jgi:predicted enzyme related to lactoylglutathione lyase
MQNPVRWFEMYVSDMNRAKDFYESLLSIKLSEEGRKNDSQIGR